MTAPGTCVICGGPVPPHPRPGHARKACDSPVCRSAIWRQAGKKRATMRDNLSGSGDLEHARLPAEALAHAVELWTRREGYDENTACELLGISHRLLFAWRRAEREVSFNQADKTLLRIDRFWWDVWTEDTVRIPIITVRLYVRRDKKVRGRVLACRERLRTFKYGDAGPDRELLRRIQLLWEGDSEVAA